MRPLARRYGAAAVFKRAPRPSGSALWRDASWLAVDLELTGLDPRRNEIIAIGAIPVREGRIVLADALYTLVRPTRRPEPAAVLVHKLRLDDLADAPPVGEAIELLLGALVGRVPVFHTAAVEQAFLRPELARRRVRLPAAADTDVLGRLWLRQRGGRVPPGVGLEALSGVLGLPAEPPHHALGDALTTAQAFIALASLLDARERQTVGSLLRAPDLLGGARRLGPV
jgi:DNA polymerase-3 subunit epsilon